MRTHAHLHKPDDLGSSPKTCLKNTAAVASICHPICHPSPPMGGSGNKQNLLVHRPAGLEAPAAGSHSTCRLLYLTRNLACVKDVHALKSVYICIYFASGDDACVDVRGRLIAVSTHPLPCGSRESDSSCQTWWQAADEPRPSLYPHSYACVLMSPWGGGEIPGRRVQRLLSGNFF